MLQKTIILRSVEKFSALCGSPSLIAVFTRNCYWSIPWTSWSSPHCSSLLLRGFTRVGTV